MNTDLFSIALDESPQTDVKAAANPKTAKKSFHEIKHALESHNKKTIDNFHKKHGHLLEQVKQNLKHKTVTIAGAALIAASMATAQAPSVQTIRHHQEKQGGGNLISKVKTILGDKTILGATDEDQIAGVLSKQFDMNLAPTLDGNRLNETYGYIGAEQHLYRWAGDSLSQHATLQKAGIAPLQGAFKNFDTAEQEEYYIAVQLHELSDWNQNWSKLKPWYRFRKMFVYNPDNGKGVVAVIGDSGPAKWTGKTFGGSPEVMEYLERVDGGQKGKVVVLFVDDPDNKVALGPVDKQSFLLSSANQISTLASIVDIN